jgi:hypothetical protein
MAIDAIRAAKNSVEDANANAENVQHRKLLLVSIPLTEVHHLCHGWQYEQS